VKSRSIQRREAAQRGEPPPEFPADPTRCPHCGVALGEMDGPYEIELDTGDEHTVKACRDYLFAEVERMRRELAAWKAGLGKVPSDE